MAGGGTIGFNNSVFLAEREHADRNFALSYQLKVVFDLTSVNKTIMTDRSMDVSLKAPASRTAWICGTSAAAWR